MVTNRIQHSAGRPVKQGSGATVPEPNKINASTPFDFSGKNLTPYGGLLPVATMLEKLGFQVLMEETVTVTGQAPTVDVKNVTKTTVLSKPMLENLPNADRLLTYATLVPGAFVAATVHAPIGPPSGLPVPRGFASYVSMRAWTTLDLWRVAARRSPTKRVTSSEFSPKRKRLLSRRATQRFSMAGHGSAPAGCEGVAGFCRCSERVVDKFGSCESGDSLNLVISSLLA